MSLDEGVELIGPMTCELRFGRFRKCVIPTYVLTAPDLEITPPVRTTVRAVLAGDCSSTFPILVRVTADDREPVELYIRKDASVRLRRDDGGPIAQVVLEDVSPMQGIASYDDTCRMNVAVDFNQPIPSP